MRALASARFRAPGGAHPLSTVRQARQCAAEAEVHRSGDKHSPAAPRARGGPSCRTLPVGKTISEPKHAGPCRVNGSPKPP
ncbi:hypothetical protein GCM10010390_37730 [Streptomyces mordarskii]|uniref:Uncharacterized protein n=1 Tax=Streptomyces mordarskii TaxID=1226758 RepID=A0ABN1D1U1_9ACTN